ncbi:MULTISPECIES: penicillin-binding protein activator [Legionella]|uniref:Penicillin-binding protein activator n=1 Tax=Legionella resiliens TaxID=2905958 RepID=A0ABS8WXL5_9GAMM|nr:MULTISPECIES: penicillin-binding protein activator [unclassified Legionella]MCE0722064.1 penicillin-binding protein activator [Legionella sp. 9fVS26]MCE3531218.1 penicillin-binding protein activator [Legionella sp. 8cVS16]QLZ70806.1 penicillin-binding protein activator [Legionella sp. PC1000]
MLIKIRVFFLLTSTFFLCQCTTAVNPPEMAAPAPAPKVEKKKKASPYSKPTGSYLEQAKNQEGIEKQQSLLRAAGRLISEGQWRQGTAILAQTSDLTPALKHEKSLLLAQSDLIRDRPQIALNKLASITERNELSAYQKIQLHELLAQAYRGTGKQLESVKERIQLETLLTDEESQANNRRTLWLTLTHIPQAELNSFAAQTANQSVLQGWVQLVLISRTYRDNPKAILAALNQWQSQYRSHPANHILPDPLDSIAHKMRAQPKQVALLLPLSGALQGPGTAVRDGFMAAYKSNNSETSMQVKTYDTDKGDVASLYQNAINDGAEYIVGPLTKSQVAAVAALSHPVPTLLLNDADSVIQENSYLFGLSPTNEAVQVAIRAKNKGYSRALIIAPGNDWGKEITKAFTQQWQKNGGRVVDTFSYGVNDDLNKKMKDFLQITNSQQREKKLRELLGQKIQPVISRRQDFDMIFLLAYPSKARQIMPLLNYYYAGDVPVYATASVYGGSANPLKDKDLDGIIFCDIPWVFAHQAGTRNWPEQFNSYNRLYALGIDSYTLATQLNQLMLFPADQSQTGEGILYLNPSQHVARVLEWGQFKQGLVHSLGETA